MKNYKINYKGWSDEASPIKSDVKIKTSHAKLVGFTLISEKHKGKKLSDEHKKKISDKSKNKIMSEEAKEKISKALSDKPKSKEHIEKLKKTKLKYKITKKQIIDAQKLFPYAKDVANHLGIDVHTYKRIAMEKNCYKKVSLSERNKKVCSTKIIAKNIETQKVIEFNSIADASRKLNIVPNNICAVCKGKYKQAKGWIFQYK